jgi:hypothetical protein
MNRRKLPGVASATKRLADGTTRKYFYAWRGGPMLKGDDGKPLAPADPVFHAAYAKAMEDTGAKSNTGLKPVPDKPTSREAKGYVYFLWVGDRIKIGFSNNPLHRMGQLHTGVSERPKMMIAKAGSRDDETKLHRSLSTYRTKGEWFVASATVINAMMTFAIPAAQMKFTVQPRPVEEVIEP